MFHLSTINTSIQHYTKRPTYLNTDLGIAFYPDIHLLPLGGRTELTQEVVLEKRGMLFLPSVSFISL